MDINQALNIFEIEEGFPQTEAELKKMFRTLSFRYHPDYGGSHIAFVGLQSAYEILNKKVKEIDRSFDSKRTIEGDLIADLGKGFAITDKDVGTCDVCNGEGYHVYHDEGHGLGIFEDCLVCKGVGLFSYECKFCKGTGKYQKTEKHTPITCKRCSGTGRFYPVNKYYPINFQENVTEEEVERFIVNQTSFFDTDDEIRYQNKFGRKKVFKVRVIPYNKNKIGVGCKTCFGLGQVERRTEGKPYYSTCYTCKGVGEIELHLFNPVLSRRRMGGNR